MPASLHADRDLCIPPTQQVCVQLLRTLTTWHYPHSLATLLRAVQQSIDISCRPGHSSKVCLRFCLYTRWDSQTRLHHDVCSNKCVCLRTLTTWHCPHSPTACRCCRNQSTGIGNNPHLEALAVLVTRVIASVSVYDYRPKLPRPTARSTVTAIGASTF